MSKSVRPVFKCHGGKFYLNAWIISNFPENYQEMTYLEPFCGGANVLLNKKKSTVEIINDLDSSVINIYQALRDEPKEFIRRLNLCKYTEETFERSLKKTQYDDYLDQAVNEFILRRMSRGGLKKHLHGVIVYVEGNPVM
jgi:DNA adenine methylase